MPTRLKHDADFSIHAHFTRSLFFQPLILQQQFLFLISSCMKPIIYQLKTINQKMKLLSRGVRLAKNDFGSVFGSVLQKNCSFRFGFGFTKLTAVSVFWFVFCTVCCLMCMTLEMTYFCAELVQLIVSQSDSELEVQRYGMKKNALTVDPIVLQDEL